jgi:hypothetical protein
MSFKDAAQTFAMTLVGVLMILAAFAWAGYDVSQHAGRASVVTLFGALAIGSAGGVLVSKTKMAELYGFLFAQASRARDFKFPKDGSGDAA